MPAEEFIAVRSLVISGETARIVTVGIKQPVSDGNDYRCDFQIVGIGDGKIRYAMGADSMQALVLALQSIGSHLYCSEESKQGRLTWWRSRNLGFPVADIIADLVPKD